MTSLQKANQKIKDLEIQLKNEKSKLKMQKEEYEEKIDNMEKNFNKQFKAIMSVVSDLENKVKKLTEENIQLKNRINLLEKENSELRKENDILKGKALQKISSNSNINNGTNTSKILTSANNYDVSQVPLINDNTGPISLISEQNAKNSKNINFSAQK